MVRISAKDKELLTNLNSIQDVEKRAESIKKLPRKDLERVVSHWVKFIKQERGYRVSGEDSKQLEQVLKPFKRPIKNFVDKVEVEASKDRQLKTVQKQKGGFLLFLLSTLLPVIVECIVSATRK